MLLMPVSSSIHYKSAFDIKNLNYHGIPRLRAEIKNWLKSHRTVQHALKKLDDTWFDLGSSEQHIVGNAYFRTAVNKGERTSTHPQNWAIEFIHKDFKEPSRLWCTEVSLSMNTDESVRFACILKYATVEGWIGLLPPHPEFSVPSLVGKILKKYECYKKNTYLQSDIHSCHVGNPENLASIILNQQRVLPIVVSVADVDGTDSVDLAKLQKITRGNANVYYLLDYDLYSFNKLLPDGLALKPGMVRVYSQYTSHSQPTTHRFFSKHFIKNIGPDAFFELLGIALSRNSRTLFVNEVVQIRDVISARATYRIQELKNNSELNECEYIKLLEDDNQQKQQKIANYIEEQSRWCEQIEELEKEIGKANAKLSFIKQGQNSIDNIPDISTLSTLPENVYECLMVAAKLFNNTVIVHENAYEVAQNFSGNTNAKSIKAAWRMLYAIATELHSLVFTNKTIDLEKEFKNITGINFAKTEGRNTKKNPQLMEQRKFFYNDKEYNCSPHLKGSSSEDYLRIHVAYCHEEHKIIIYHCGEHLDNYTTQKRR